MKAIGVDGAIGVALETNDVRVGPLANGNVNVDVGRLRKDVLLIQNEADCYHGEEGYDEKDAGGSQRGTLLVLHEVDGFGQIDEPIE